MRTTSIFNHFGRSCLRKIALRSKFWRFLNTGQGCSKHCVAAVLLLCCCCCVAAVLLLCCCCVAAVLLLRCCCVAAVLLLCCWCVAAVLLLCCCCVAAVLLLRCCCVAAVSHASSMGNTWSGKRLKDFFRQKRLKSFNHMLGLNAKLGA